MSIKINHSDLQLFERLTSKLVKPSELPETVYFVPDSGGMTISAVSSTAILTLTLPPVGRVTPFTLPWTTIKQLSAVPNKGDDIDVNADGQSAMLSWYVKGVPQQMSAKSSVPPDDFMPSKPDKFGTFQAPLFDALVDAGKYVDADNTRYSLGAICLRGKKAQIISTDGRQALIQDGFAFPWEGDVLCPVSKIFGAKEFRKIEDTVMVGAKDTWIFFEIGNVSICLKALDGRYPRLDQFTKDTDSHTWLEINPADASFVAERLASLPGKKDREFPVYIHLNDNILVRGHDRERHTATELRMNRSRYEGDDAMTAVNRHYLKNALDLGITRLGIDSKDTTPLVGYGERKTFVLMPLEGDEPKVANENITVLESGPATPGKSRTPLPVLSSVTTAMATAFPGSSEIIDVKGRKPKRTNPVNVLPTVPAKSRIESKSEPTAERENPDRMTKSEYRAAIAELRASLRDALSNLSRLERAFSKSRMRERELLKREREIALGQKQIRQTAAMIGKLQA